MDTSLTQSHWSLLEDAPSPGHRLLMLPFLPHNGPHCQVETRSLTAFITTVTYRLTVRDAGFPGATGFLLQCQYTSSKHLCILHTGVASWRALSILAFRAARRIHCTVPVAVRAALCRRGELTPVHLSSAVQGTVHHFAVFRWSPHQEDRSHTVPRAMRWPRSSYIQWSLRLFSLLGTLPPLLMWSLRLLSLLGILSTTPIYCSSSCS